MRKLSLLIVIVILLTSCASKKTNEGFTINGRIANCSQGKIYLIKTEGKKKIPVDSVDISKDGKFSFTGKISMPEMYYLKPENLKAFGFFLMNSEITINANADSLECAKITGSKVHDKFLKFKKEGEKFTKKTEELYNALENAPIEKKRELDEQISKANTEYKEFVVAYAKANSSCVIAPYVIWREVSSLLSLKELEAVTTSLSDSIKESTYMKTLQNMVSTLKNVEPGMSAPDFSLPDSTGKLFTLSSLRGKYVLIDFWASWCPDCRRELPQVVELWKKYKTKGLQIVGVSLDKEKKAWESAIHKGKLDWINVSDLQGWESAVGKKYAVSWIPQTYLIDKEGKILVKGLSLSDLEREIEKIVKN